jgi:hypothetical protein
MKKRIWNITWIVLFVLTVDILLHRFLAPSPQYSYPVSIFVETGWFLPAVVVMLLIIYLALAIVFQALQARLPGTKRTKGIVFGIAFGGLMLVSSPAMTLLFGSPLLDELRIGLVDGLAIFLLGLLLGQFTATDGSPAVRQTIGRAASSIGAVGFSYFALQCLICLPLPFVFPSFQAQTAETLLWTLGVGLWIGLMDWLLQDAYRSDSFIYQAAWFTGIVYGIFSIGNVLVAPIFVAVPLSDLLPGTGAGLLGVFVGILVSRFVLQRLSENSSPNTTPIPSKPSTG